MMLWWGDLRACLHTLLIISNSEKQLCSRSINYVAREIGTPNPRALRVDSQYSPTPLICYPAAKVP